MNKPITVAREEFKQQLIDAITHSDLPAFVVLDILNAAASEVGRAAAQQYAADLKAYQENEGKPDE